MNPEPLHFTRWGEEGSTPILLVHGWTGDNTIFKEFRNLLAEQGFDVVAVDLRGHGQSPKPKGDYSLEVFSEDIRNLIEKLGWSKGFVMLGQSMGGAVVLDYALRFPETLTHLIPCNTSINMRGTFFSRLVWQITILLYTLSPALNMKIAFSKFFPTPQPPEMAKKFIDMSLQTPRYAGLGAIRSIYPLNLEPKIVDIKVPTLVVTSEFDQQDLRNATLQIHKQIPDAKLLDIDGAGHLPFIEQPELMASAIREFVKE